MRFTLRTATSFKAARFAMSSGMRVAEFGDGVAMLGDRLQCDEILPKASAFGDV